MKQLKDYTSQELYDELKRRNEDIEILEIHTLDHNGITVADIVIKYGSDIYGYLRYAPHIKQSDGTLEFIYYDYELQRKIMPSCFSEEMEGIYCSGKTLEQSLEIFKRCGIEYERDDNFFQE